MYLIWIFKTPNNRRQIQLQSLMLAEVRWICYLDVGLGGRLYCVILIQNIFISISSDNFIYNMKKMRKEVIDKAMHST